MVLRVLARWTSRKLRWLPAKRAKGVEGLDDAGAGGPAAADAAGQGEHGHATAADGVRAARAVGAGFILDHVAGADFLDLGVDGQPVARQADAARAQVVAQPLVLHSVEAVGGF